ncbi:MAG: aromatic ring-hydroxylating dioxygenase subunit alpha [Proteobacteria bacterium]|nr:aromatic ring-hydroxylating dioxygenase subunit alpha [Pseudomonadota bacterium]
MTISENISTPDDVWPTSASGFCVPYEVFTDKAYYDREQEAIFRGDAWSFVGLEAELPNSGDYKSTFIGETPVLVTRDNDGNINVMQNRCAHRGALVCRERRGNTRRLQCVYHQWAYDLKGQLRGVPFRAGIAGKGGMPEGFDLTEHGLNRLRSASINGLIFATFSRAVVSLEEFLGPMIIASIQRIFNRPIEILGDQRQYIHGNWKLYAENTRDPYHASLLHLFHTTFGLYRSSQTGECLMDGAHRHSMLYAKASSSNTALEREVFKDVRSYDENFKLADSSVLQGRPDFDDGITLVIMALFPNLVIQQIANTLAVRQSVTDGADGFELVWTHFGYLDDDEEMRNIRIKQSNLIGPAGYVSMEDGEAVEIVQKAVRRDRGAGSYIAMGGGVAEDADHLVTESAIIGFWQHYKSMLGIAP